MLKRIFVLLFVLSFGLNIGFMISFFQETKTTCNSKEHDYEPLSYFCKQSILDPEQKDKTDMILKDLEYQLIDIKKQISMKRSETLALMKEKHCQRIKINQTVHEIGQLQEQIEKEILSSFISIKEILREDQEKLFLKWIENRIYCMENGCNKPE